MGRRWTRWWRERNSNPCWLLSPSVNYAAAVVMMKPVEDGQRDDVPGEFRAPMNWLLLVDALMRAGHVESMRKREV
jgi:hypothetical protein